MDMIEKVARAINAARVPDGYPDILEEAERRWNELPEFREKYRRQARAAIEAMREPTAAMVRQGEDRGAGIGPGAVRCVWDEMIDAALSKTHIYKSQNNGLDPSVYCETKQEQTDI